MSPCSVLGPSGPARGTIAAAQVYFATGVLAVASERSEAVRECPGEAGGADSDGELAGPGRAGRPSSGLGAIGGRC
jgi:hypothetical protein